MQYNNKEGTNRKGKRERRKIECTFQKVKKLGAATLLTFTFLLSTVSAQESLNATGGKASGSGGMVTYTVGQIVYTTIPSVNNSVAQGVQQPYEISVVTAIKGTEDISLETIVYPNPTSDFLILKSGKSELRNLHYHLYDLKGTQLFTGRMDDYETTISVGNLKPAVYLLSIKVNDMTIKTFSIVKK